jgi:hypothetical protein
VITVLSLGLLVAEMNRSTTDSLVAGPAQQMRSTSVRPTVSTPLASNRAPEAQSQLLVAPNGTLAVRQPPAPTSPTDTGDSAGGPTGEETANASTSVTAGSSPSSDATADGTSITLPVTVLSSASPASSANRAEQAATFRALLAQAGLQADNIDIDALAELGSTVCLLASVADTPDAFRSTRVDLINATSPTSTLNVLEIGAAVNAAALAYCPADADRLGLSV